MAKLVQCSFQVQALVSFEGEGTECMSFSAGEVLEVLRWNKSGHWWARHENGKMGWLASTKVRPVVNSKESSKSKVNSTDLQSKSTEISMATSMVTVETSQGLAEPSDNEIWPPLPPGPPPRGQPRTSVATHSEENCFDDYAFDDYAQNLCFRFGRVSAGPSEEYDRVLQQMGHYLDVNAWSAQQAARARHLGPGKPTGDGGIKRSCRMNS
eukprot:CAMPEP_0197631508 /NCGR_PEP_ID=MMETSP1338-20131121/8648_1 /TAXON_ID=43686 ORGANISM="Pelagodinium beii, Strain RCC1491" /NCGR_SAMPLE_ID=MMETSP1338 /ASSEMBLY_ACC=CAM_ASM_000754 /LENGTH=210 /DNA_ID=CAMNT_0043202977 /DNA_START=62 /DNA_END=690 /DNA_ORIENTATION=+